MNSRAEITRTMNSNTKQFQYIERELEKAIGPTGHSNTLNSSALRY